MASRIIYKGSIGADLRRLDPPVVRRVLDKLERTLSANPNAGAPLTGEFKGLFKYRVGEYRVLYAKTTEGLLILRIRHRKDAYR